MTSKRTLARQKEFKYYKQKWGLSKYRLYTHSCASYSDINGHLYIVRNNTSQIILQISNYSSVCYDIESDLGSKLFEIRSLNTLLRKICNKNTKILLYDAERGYEVESFDELKATLLIRKLAGV